jgi:hypothetical protein
MQISGSLACGISAVSAKHVWYTWKNQLKALCKPGIITDQYGCKS